MGGPRIVGIPRIEIEILSDARRDRIVKREAYGRLGVPEYWIVDPDSEWIEVYRNPGGGFGTPELLRAGDELRTEALPGFALDVRALFDNLPPTRR